MNSTYNIGLDYLNPNQMQKEFTINQNMSTLDNMIGASCLKFVLNKMDVLASIMMSTGGISRNLFIIDPNTTEPEWVDQKYFDYILIVPFGTNGENVDDYKYIKPRNGFILVYSPIEEVTNHDLLIYHEPISSSYNRSANDTVTTNWKKAKLEYQEE